LWKMEGCKCKIEGLRTYLKLISKIQEPNYDLILENGESINEESRKLGIVS
jgi:hypothetical protein